MSIPIHVKTHASGRWTVQPENADRPLSEHADASAATRAATAIAEAQGGGDVIVHDRYHCVHVSPHRAGQQRRRP